METTNTTLETLLVNQNILLESINKQLQASHYQEALVVGLIVAFGGAFAAFFFSELQKKQEKEKGNLRSIVVSLNGMILELEDLALEYWLSNASDNEMEDYRNAIKIKNILKMIRKYKDLYSQSSSDSKYLQYIETFCSSIFDVATGDDFESPRRKKSRYKAAIISRECTEAKATLNEIVISL